MGGGKEEERGRKGSKEGYEEGGGRKGLEGRREGGGEGSYRGCKGGLENSRPRSGSARVTGRAGFCCYSAFK